MEKWKIEEKLFQKRSWIPIWRRIFSAFFVPEQPTGGRLQKIKTV